MLEYIDGNASGMRAVRYLKPAELSAHPEKITDELPSLWILAEQGAPVSIADDFEHGISTEHRHMPDTLSIEVCIMLNAQTGSHMRCNGTAYGAPLKEVLSGAAGSLTRSGNPAQVPGPPLLRPLQSIRQRRQNPSCWSKPKRPIPVLLFCR
ncbi:MAG: hypothetical protein IPH00_13050 [Flavobacteriales bacterium]|nr:hypothetical protein [Flavobacteriales bacterium]